MANRLIGKAFPKFSEADWRALVAASTGDRNFEGRSSRSDDGIPVGPVYRQDAGGRVLSNASKAGWTIIQRIDTPDGAVANAEIRADVEGGAGGFDLIFSTSALAREAGIAVGGTAAAVDGLLGGIALDTVSLRIDAGEATPGLASAILNLARRRGIDPSEVDLTLAFDPIATLAARGWLHDSFDKVAAGMVGGLRELEEAGVARGAATIADGRPWHPGGASEAQELAAVLSAFVTYLRLFGSEGIPAARAVDRIGIALAADADQFLTIAKFRAMRLLHARVVESLGLAARSCRIHAETAWRMMSRRDVHVNILRTTSAAFAAGMGGADSITVLPFTTALGAADSLARRLARNGQTILIEEASLGRVADPGAGAGAVEALTEALAAKAWERFQTIEAGGGLLQAVRAGALQEEVAAMREARLKRVRTREIELIGINLFVDPAEATIPFVARRAAEPSSSARREQVEPLSAIRLAQPFEDLRDRADALAAAGLRPTVFLAKLGTAAETAASADLAIGFLASGGIVTIAPEAVAIPQAVEAFARSSTPFACICAGDRGAPSDVAELARALKMQGARRVLLAGRPDLARAPGIDVAIGPDTDAVALIGDLIEICESAMG